MEQLTITIPEGWHEVSINKWNQILHSDNPLGELLGIYDDIFKLNTNDLDLILSELVWVNEGPTSKWTQTITINEKDFKVREDLFDLSIEELARFERLASDFNKNILDIALWLFNTEDSDILEISVESFFGILLHSQLTCGFLVLELPQAHEIIKQMKEDGETNNS